MKIRFILAILICLFVAVPYTFAQESLATQSGSRDTFQDDVDGYAMPYPGILPDNPLYPMKLFRDALVGFLISDPMKKIDFHLLLADKRLGAGVSLYQKGNRTLGYKTLTEGEEFFGQALEDIAAAKKQGMIVTDKAHTMYVSSLKHQELLHDLQQNAPEDKQKLADLIKKSERFSQTANRFIPK